MSESLDEQGIHPDVQAAVPSEKPVIDPRGVGNEAQHANHHCRPNCRLEQIQIKKKVL